MTIIENENKKAFHCTQSEQKTYHFLAEKITVIVSGEQTNGEYSLAHVTEAPKLGPPLHIHHEDDESFYILKGQVTFYIGDEIIEASTGDYVFAPKGIPHRLVSGPEQAEFLVTSTPAKFDAFVKELGTPVFKDADLPEVKTPSPEELQHLVKVAEAFNMTILG